MKLRLYHFRIAAVALALPLSLYGYLNGDSLSAYYYGRIGSNNSGGISSILTVGTNNIANGPQSAAIGNSLQNYQPNNLTVGQYNTPVTGDLFTVGNGSGQYDPVTGNTNRSNALSVTTDGVNIPGTAEINSIPAQGGIANFTGTPPAWWSTGLYNIFSTQTQGGSDSSPANIGQLKHVTSRAKAYFDTRFSAAGGAALPGDINTMLTEHIDRDAPVAVGQLKYVAQTFYDRLIQRGYSVAYPWSSGPGDPGNAAPATIGQIKQAFSFDLGFSNTDTDGDGLTDWAEYDGAGNPSKFDLPKLTLQYAWREANGKDSITGQGSGTLRKVKGVATGDGSREWEMQQPPPPGQEVSALFALYSIINSPAEFPFSGWESWPGLVNARFDQALVGDAASTLFPMPVTSHTYHRREIKVRLHADRPMPVTWKVHLSQMLTQKIGPTLTQSFEPEVVVLEIPMGGQEAIYTLFPGSAHPGQPNTQFPNREAFLDYQLVTTGTSGPVVFDGPAKDSDGDGVLDAVEILVGTDPFSPSSSGDGIKDGDSKVTGIRTLNLLVGYSRRLKYDYIAPNPPNSGNGGVTTFVTSWGQEPPPTLGVFESFETLKAILGGKEFPALPPNSPPSGPMGIGALIKTLLISSLPGKPGLDAHGASNPSMVVNRVECRHGNLLHRRLWAVHFPAPSVPTTRSFLKVTKRISLSLEEVVSTEAVVFNFVANNPISTDFTDLLPGFEKVDGPETVNVSLVPVEVAADINGDSVIASGESATELKPFEIWINDDDDPHAPGAPQQSDYISPQVDGAKDLEDFMPVFLGIKRAVAALPPSASVKYKLKQADGALNFCETTMLQSEAFTRGGNSLTAAPTKQITPAGVELSTAFLNGIRDYDKGVILVEGQKPSKEPLVLVIEQNGVPVAELPLHTTIAARIVLLLHGMNSNTGTWEHFVSDSFSNSLTGVANIVDGDIQGTTAPLMTHQGVRCYRLQFGFYDPGSTRVGLEGVTASSTINYLADIAEKRCGDFETFAELGQEVDDAIFTLLDPATHPEYQYAKIVLVGHSRGGIAAREFLQGTSSRRSSVVGLVTTGSPHQGSPMGRIFKWLDDHKRNAAGTDADDWEVVDLLLGQNFDVRRPVIGDLAELTTFNAGVSSLPTSLRCAELVYQRQNLGGLARLPAGLGIYTVFDEPGGDLNPGEQLSPAAQTYILGAGFTSASFPGDGLIPGPNQRFTTLPGFGAVTVAPVIHTTYRILHVEEPKQVGELRSQLKATAPKWFP